MEIPTRWLPILAAGVLVAGCSHGEARFTPRAAYAPGAVPAAAPAVTATVAPELPTPWDVAQLGTQEPARRPPLVQLVGERLALAWCMAGGTSFGPLGRDDALGACSDVTLRVSELQTEGQLTSAVIELSVDTHGSEEQRYVYLESGKHMGVFLVARAFSSGVGGYSHSVDVTNIQLRDVHGDGTPEWYAEIASEEHDTDMGLCAAHGESSRDLVLCTLEGAAFSCLAAPIARHRYQEKGANSADGCGPMRTTDTGFARTVRVEPGFIQLDRDAAARFDKPTRPPFHGRQRIEELLRSAPATPATF